MVNDEDTTTALRPGVVIDEAWASQGLALDELVVHDGTIRSGISAADTMDADDLLPNLLEAPLAEVVLEGIIGRGGLAQVEAGRQRSLRRSVAIKRLRQDSPVGADASPLLREARVTGALEHPNIVPIHLVGHDDTGRPLIVMKRIEGQSWAELLDARTSVDEGLERHLRILLEVCRALRFAHEQGVLHRDIKPDNVMVGRHEDVYVLDWGLAVALRPNGIDDLPLAEHGREIVGTPGYMAPEMVLGDGREFSTATDVYLLGAVLHHIVTGAPPHQGDSVRSMLEDAMVDRPPYPPDVPWELARLCRHSMALFPAQRPATVAAFATAVEEYLTHRHSYALAARAADQLVEVEALATKAADDPRWREPLYRAFGACRFGFIHAVEVTPDNTLAAHGLQELIGKMARFELDHGSTSAAQTLVAELPVPDRALQTEVKQAAKREAAERTQLEEVAKGQDVTIGDTQRGWMAIGTGLVVIASFWSLAALRERGAVALDHGVLGVSFGVFLAVAVGIAVKARTIFFDTAANARTSWNYLVGFAGFTGLWPLSSAIGMSIEDTFTVGCWIGSALVAVAALTADRRFAPLAGALVGGAITTAIWSHWALELFGAWFGAGAIAVGGVWLRDGARAAKMDA